MKACKGCGARKAFSEFPKNKASSDGHYRLCKCCNAAKLRARNCQASHKAKRAEYLAANRERVNAQSMTSYYRRHAEAKAAMRARRNADKARRIEATRAWRAANPDRVKETRNAWFAARPGYVNERGMRRYAAKVKATPAWADVSAIRAVYAQARAMRRAGLDVHVDHIVPLRGANVTGFHVHTNLRIVSADENRRKSNTWAA